MAVSGISSTTTTTKTVDKNSTGFNGLNADAFMKLLIAQLQNQDPTSPVGNEELLQQISSMRNLQSNIELSDTLKSLSSNQQISAGAGFLGKVITGLDDQKQPVSGIADQVFIQNGVTRIGIGTTSLPVSSVTGIGLLTQ